ncbi:MAG: pilus assembly PilX N-terminal domain-containing protein [Patescibacteria group bacterium]
MNNIFKENNGTALLMTLLILTSILVVTLGAASLIIPGIKMSRTQEQSTKAFFAAEAGVEKALWEVRKNSYAIPEVDTDNVFSGSLGNNSAYQADCALSLPQVTFTSTGSYRQTRRSVAVNFEVSGEYGGGCMPDCVGKLCGVDDGCGDICPSSCISSPGCSSAVLLNASIASGSCCEGECYECDEGYSWDGEACVQTNPDEGCVADCLGKSCGDDDGCGNACPASCAFLPGCRADAVANSNIAAGSCCEGGCYKCDEGYSWDGNSCVAGVFDAATFDGWCWDCPEYTYPDPQDPLFGDIKEYIDSRF